MSNTEY